MSQTLSPSFARCYGLARVARVWKISRASVYRSLKETPPNTSARRPGPVGACSDAELADHIRQQIAASRLHGEGYRKLWARLRFAGVRASPRRVRRVMRENGLLAPHRVGRTEGKPHDGTIITDKVNEMWGTDMTQTITVGEGRAYVFVAVEHANSEVVGIHASRSANRFEALEPVSAPPSAHTRARAPPWSCRLQHRGDEPALGGDRQRLSRPAPTLCSWSIRQAGICQRVLSCRQTSPSCRCRRNPPSSTRSRTSGSSCATIGSRTVSSNPTMISSTTAARLGTSSSINPGASCPSDCANGRTGYDHCDLV